MDYFNRAFTDLIRRTYPDRWGNWSLDPNISAGSVGIVDPESGTFRLVKSSLPDLSDSDLIQISQGSSWNFMTSDVNRRETEVQFSGEVVDPETGLAVKAGVEVTWSMEKSGSVVSECSLAMGNPPIFNASQKWS